MNDWRPFAPIDGTMAEASTDARASSRAHAEASSQGERADGSEKTKNYAAEAAIKAGDFRFQRFLAERHGLLPPLTKERATQRLRSLLGVSSRAELNSDAAAAERWARLRRDFEAWLRATEPQQRQWRGRDGSALPRYGDHRE